MKINIDSLTKCVLFQSLDKDEIEKVLQSVTYIIKEYGKEDIIAIEDDECSSLGIILDGSVEIQKSFSYGKVVTINHFEAGNIFGEALVFSGQHTYPANVVSSSDTKIIFIPKENIIKMMTLDTRILNNFTGVLSDRILMLNERMTNLSHDTLRKKIINILLLEYNRQKTSNLTLPYSRKKMAELLNIPRPSLSRELINMKEDKLIDFYKNKFKILDLKALEESLL